MAEKLVTNIISKDAFDEVKNLSKEMDILVQKLEQAITNAKNFDAAFKSAKGVIEFEKALYNTVDAQNALIKTGEQLKDNYVKQEAAQKVVIDQTKALTNAIKDSVGIVDILDSKIDINSKKLAENKVALSENKKEQADLKKLYNEQKISLDSYTDKLGVLIKAEANLKVITSELDKEQKQFAKSINTAEDSIDRGSNTLARFTDEFRKLSDVDKNSEFGKELLKNIDALDPAVKKANERIGNFKMSVGDYTNSINKSSKGAFGGAFNVLVTELNEIKQKLQDPALNGKAFESLSKQGALLEQVLEGVSKEFTSTRQESRAFQEAATKLGLAFDINSEQFQKFRTEVGKGVDDIRDIKDSIRLASSDTKGLDRLVGAAQGLTGAFNVAQGAAALLGDENEELQKTLVKLQAATSILNGLQAIQNELKNKDSVFSKAINFLRGQETKLTIAQTEAQAANAVATNAGAAATSRLGLAMKALGIGAVLAVISGLVYVFNKLGEATEEAGRKQKLLNDVIKESKTAYSEAIKEVSTLKNEVQLAKDGFISKDEVVKHYNETVGKAAGQVKTLSEVEEKITKDGPAYIQMMFQKAIATEAFKKAAEAAVDAETTSIKDNLTAIDIIKTSFTGLFESTTDKILDATNISKKTKFQKDSDDFLEIAKNAQDKAAQISKDSKLNLFDNKGDNKGNNDAAKKLAEEAKKSAKAAFDELKAEAEERIKIFKTIAENEKNNYYLRLVGLENYQKEQKELIETEQKYLLNVPKITAGEVQKINGDAKRKLNELEFDAGQQRIAIIKKNAEEEKAVTEQLRNEIDRTDNKDAQKDTITKNTNEPYLKFAETNALEYKIDIENLNKSLQQKKISIKEYNEEKAKIDEKYEERSLSNQIENNKALIDNLKGQGFDVSDLLKKQAELEMMFSDLTTKHFIENEEKKAAKRKEIQDKSVELFNEVAKLFETAVLAGYDREKNEIQDQINAREEQKTKEIEAVNAEGISAQEKANKIVVINTRAQAQKEQLERRQRQIDLERARFERAFNIGQIIAKTAIAVIAQSEKLPFSAPLVALVASIGAIQLAAALAQPLPKFAKGTKDSGKAGFAIVGEEGVEQIETKDGKKFLTPDVPTITYLPEHTKVTPKNELMLQKARETALYNSLKPIEYNVNNTQQQLQIEKLENLMEQTVSAIKSKPVAHITNTWKGVETSYQDVKGWTKYINTYINS